MTNKEKKEFTEFQLYKLRKAKKELETKLSVITEDIKIKSAELKNIVIRPKK